MNKVASIVRLAVLVSISIVSFACLFMEPNEHSQSWSQDFVISKVIAFAGLWCASRWYKRMQKTDPSVAANDRWSTKALREDGR